MLPRPFPSLYQTAVGNCPRSCPSSTYIISPTYNIFLAGALRLDSTAPVVMPSSVAPLPVLSSQSAGPPISKSPPLARPPAPPPLLARAHSTPGARRGGAPLEITGQVTGQPAVVGVPVRTGADDPSGSTDQQQRKGRHTRVHIAPAPGAEPPRTADRAKRSRWFGLSQTEKEVAALQERLAGMDETEHMQVEGAARHLQERWRCTVIRVVRLVTAAHAALYCRSGSPASGSLARSGLPPRAERSAITAWMP